MSSEDAVDCTAWLLAFSLVLQSLELWLARAEIARVYPWPLVRREYGLAIGDPSSILLLLQTALAITLLGRNPVFPWLSFVVALLIAARFRGNFNGGSDAMTFVVLLGLAVARSFSQRVGLGYIAAQLVLSYFLAGLFKLRDPDWRNGSALAALLRAPQYRSTALQLPFARWLGYGVIAFECAFPLAFFDARALSVLGIAFHVLNARVLGLNRFLWAWLAAYPALWYWS